MKIISLYNMKGGVGKTTICVNLAYLAARDGYRTLLLDLDPQGAASFYFKVRPGRKFNTKKLLGGGKSLRKAVKASDYENLDLVPATLSYRNLDLKLDNKRRGIKQLKKSLSSLKNDYDLVFIDSPPNLTLLSENIIAASSLVIIPLIPTTLSMAAYNKLKSFLKKKNYDLSKICTLFSMAELRKAMHKNIMREFVSKNILTLKTVIPYRTEIEKMGLNREPINAYRKSSKAAKKFDELWSEIKSMREW